jgi:hypothetical protein
MACNELEEIIKSCDNNTGGIYTAYIGDMDDIASITEDPATWTITAMTLDALTPALPFYFKRNTSNYTDEVASDLIAGSSFATATINLVFHRREADKSKAIKILGEGQRYLYVVIGDANGLFWYFPYMQLTANTGGSGTARADGSNYNVTLVGQNEFNAKTMSAAIAASLLVATS